MTKEEIIEMAIAGHASTRDAIRWAIAQEREACADICELIWGCNGELRDAVEAIRARGQA